MTEWIECKLSDIGEIVGGATPSTKDDLNYDGDIAWLTPKDLSTFTERYIKKGERSITEKGYMSCSTKILPVNSILFSSRAPIGYVAIAANKMCTNQGFKSIIPNEKVDYMFLYYLLKYKKSAIEGMGSGTTFKEVSGNVMKNIEVRIPKEKSVQKRIAEILDKIDSKIENNNAINRNLLEQAITVFKEKIWSKDKNGTIGDYCVMKSGFAFKSSWWTEEGVKVIKIGDINQDNLSLNTCSHVDEDKVKKARDYIVKSGDMVLAMTGATIGKFAMVPERKETILVNQRVGKFFLGDEPLKKVPFIYCTLKMDDVYSEVIGRGQGSAQPNISGNDVMTIPCVIPTEEEIDAFNLFAEPIFTSIVKNQNENEQLAYLRDSLLPKLMSGELDVSGLEI